MDLDMIIVPTVVALALAYVIRRFIRARRGESCCAGTRGACACSRNAPSDRTGCRRTPDKHKISISPDI